MNQSVKWTACLVIGLCTTAANVYSYNCMGIPPDCTPGGYFNPYYFCEGISNPQKCCQKVAYLVDCEDSEEWSVEVDAMEYEGRICAGDGFCHVE